MKITAMENPTVDEKKLQVTEKLTILAGHRH